MKTLPAQAEVATVVDAIFRRWPSLIGFHVQRAPFPATLVVSELETDRRPAQSRYLEDEVVAALLDLIDEEPAARELLCGRTFARTLH